MEKWKNGNCLQNQTATVGQNIEKQKENMKYDETS